MVLEVDRPLWSARGRGEGAKGGRSRGTAEREARSDVARPGWAVTLRVSLSVSLGTAEREARSRGAREARDPLRMV